MTKAILLGSIGVLIETSEMQRKAFNQAFAEAGLAWEWSPEDYTIMLKKAGGRARIERFAKSLGTEVDAQALHTRKSDIFQDAMARGVTPRDGIVSTIKAAQNAGVALGFVTTTSQQNVSIALSAARGITADDFDFIGYDTMVNHVKPAPDIYDLALKELGLQPGDALAVEDSAISAEAALSAGVRIIAFPGKYHKDDVFPAAKQRVDRLEPQHFGL